MIWKSLMEREGVGCAAECLEWGRVDCREVWSLGERVQLLPI